MPLGRFPFCWFYWGALGGRRHRRGVSAAAHRRGLGSDSANYHDDGRCGTTTAVL